MNRERLDHLIEVLEGVERANMAFNLDSWAMHKRIDLLDPAKDSHTVGSVKETCGTACCAMGYAALDSLFAEQGLKLAVDTYNPKTDEESIVHVSSLQAFNALMRKRSLEIQEAQPVFRGTSGFDAAQGFFGITYDASTWLFSPAAYSGAVHPSHVIDRIREVIRLNGCAPASWAW